MYYLYRCDNSLAYHGSKDYDWFFFSERADISAKHTRMVACVQTLEGVEGLKNLFQNSKTRMAGDRAFPILEQIERV
jgi:hypothetical protein